MKSPFRSLYATAEILSGLALVSMLVLIATGIVYRLVGSQLPGSDDLSGYGLVALLFLALAPTYRHGEHIRVGLLVERLHGRPRYALELLIQASATLGAGWAGFWLGRMVYDSWRFHSVAQGLLPVPLWIPQTLMVIGMAIFFIALAEDLILYLRRRPPAHRRPLGETNLHYEH